MFGFFKNAAANTKVGSELSALIGRYNDKETAEGMVAVMTGVAYQKDGMEPAERQGLNDAFNKHPIFVQYDKAVLIKKFSEVSQAYDFFKDEGDALVKKELQDVVKQGAAYEKRVAILRMGKFMAARSEDGTSPEETAFLRQCATWLGVSPADAGL